LIKHLEHLLKKPRDGRWVFDVVRSIKNSQHVGDADDEALLFVCALEVLLESEDVDDD